MKIYTEINYEWDGDQLVVVSEKSYEERGEVALCKGGGGGTTYDWEGANLYAEVSRDQFEDYKRRFAPWEDKLIAEAEKSPAEDIAMAKKYAGSALQGQKNAMGLNMSRMGVGQTDAQKASTDRSFGLKSAAAQANATNIARQHADERQTAIMAGGMESLGKATGRGA